MRCRCSHSEEIVLPSAKSSGNMLTKVYLHDGSKSTQVAMKTITTLSLVNSVFKHIILNHIAKIIGPKISFSSHKTK